MLGLGLGTDKNTSKAIGSSGFSSSILFERNEDWVSGDISVGSGGVAFSGCSLSIGTSDVGGITNYLVMTKSGGGNADPQAFLGSTRTALFSTDPQDIYEAGSGTFQMTAKAYIPSSNTSTGSNAIARCNGVNNPGASTEDQWITVAASRAVSAITNPPNNDADFFEVEFNDNTTSEPNDGDVMYVAQFKCEFIAD